MALSKNSDLTLALTWTVKSCGSITTMRNDKPRSTISQTTKNRAWLIVSLIVARLKAVTVSANQPDRDFVPCDWMAIQQIYHISSKHSTRIFIFEFLCLGVVREVASSHSFFLSSSEIQVSEESLSQVNSTLKQVTIELETARGEVRALNDTKDLVTKEINDLQQTLTGKLVLHE